MSPNIAQCTHKTHRNCIGNVKQPQEKATNENVRLTLIDAICPYKAICYKFLTTDNKLLCMDTAITIQNLLAENGIYENQSVQDVL